MDKKEIAMNGAGVAELGFPMWPQFDQRGNHTGAEVHEVISNKMIFNVLTPNEFLALS